MELLISKKELYQTIFKRKSVRKYQPDKLSQNKLRTIKEFLKTAAAVQPETKFETKIVNSDQIKSLISIKAPHYLQFFSEKKGDYLLNAGFILQQLDLYLAASNLGSCWYGLAKPRQKAAVSDFDYVITMVFGRAAEKNYRDSIEDFKRRPLAEIKSGKNYYDLLEAARLAPSATNSQPWFFKVENHKIHIFQQQANFIKKLFYQKLNRIDMGIALAHLWLAAGEKGCNFNFKKYSKAPAEITDYKYLASVEL